MSELIPITREGWASMKVCLLRLGSPEQYGLHVVDGVIVERLKLRALRDQLGAMIDNIGHPDYSLHELVGGMRYIRDQLFEAAKEETA